MIVLVCGGRDFSDYTLLKESLDKIKPTQIISGGAQGADSLAEVYANELNIPIKVFKADWKTYGRPAGMIRNQKMLDEGMPDLVVAFPGGRGTADMVKRAKREGFKVVVVVPHTQKLDGSKP